MIGGNFTTFGNNRIHLTQFSHTPKVNHFFLTLFHSTQASQLTRGASVATMGAQPPWCMDTSHQIFSILKNEEKPCFSIKPWNPFSQKPNSFLIKMLLFSKFTFHEINTFPPKKTHFSCKIKRRPFFFQKEVNLSF